MREACERIAALNRKLVEEDGLGRGVRFPTEFSLDHVAAHPSRAHKKRLMISPTS